MKKSINLISVIISSMVGLIGIISRMAFKKEGKFGKDMNYAFKGLIVITIIINTIYYTAQIQDLMTKISVFGIELILAGLIFLLYIVPKLDEKDFIRDYKWTL